MLSFSSLLLRLEIDNILPLDQSAELSFKRFVSSVKNTAALQVFVFAQKKHLLS